MAASMLYSSAVWFILALLFVKVKVYNYRNFGDHLVTQVTKRCMTLRHDMLETNGNYQVFP